MDTQQLRAFISVAETQSFSLAADQLHLTQPAVSKRVAGLEQSLDSKLLDRLGRSIQLTEAGKALLPRARRILAEMQDAQQAINNLAGTIQGDLTIATSHHIGLHHLPTVLRSYLERYPEVSLQLEFLDSDTAYEAVQRGKVELAVITLAQQEPDNICTLPLWRDPLEFVVANNHHLASLQTQSQALTLEQLSDYPAILPDATQETTRAVEKLMQEQGAQLNLALPTNYLETIKMMVHIGLGWSILPRTMLDDQLAVLKFKGINIERSLGCITPENRSQSNAAQAFIHELKQLASR